MSWKRNVSPNSPPQLRKAEEGWLRPQIKCCEAIFEGADGVVLFQKISGCLNQPPRPRLSKEREQFLMARPPLLRQGGEFFAQPRKMSKLWGRFAAEKRRHSYLAPASGSGSSGFPYSVSLTRSRALATLAAP